MSPEKEEGDDSENEEEGPDPTRLYRSCIVSLVFCSLVQVFGPVSFVLSLVFSYGVLGSATIVDSIGEVT